MPDPLDRLSLAQQKIDELFGADYARAHPEVLVVVVQSAASDWGGGAPGRRDRARGHRPGRARGGAAAHCKRERAAAGAAMIVDLPLRVQEPGHAAGRRTRCG